MEDRGANRHSSGSEANLEGRRRVSEPYFSLQGNPVVGQPRHGAAARAFRPSPNCIWGWRKRRDRPAMSVRSRGGIVRLPHTTQDGRNGGCPLSGTACRSGWKIEMGKIRGAEERGHQQKGSVTTARESHFEDSDSG